MSRLEGVSVRRHHIYHGGCSWVLEGVVSDLCLVDLAATRAGGVLTRWGSRAAGVFIRWEWGVPWGGPRRLVGWRTLGQRPSRLSGRLGL
jgi:hypothetical protein